MATAAGLMGCTVKKTEVPELSGPSELGLSVQTRVTPDILDQDGFSQASIVFTARGPDSRPVSGVPIRLETRLDGQIVDYGRLSSKSVITGSDGIARVTYTSPPRTAEAVDTFTVVTIWYTPIGSDYNGSESRFVEIRLKPVGVVVPGNTLPVADFVVTPQPVNTYTPVTFDATGTTDEGRPCGSDCFYAWDFGDGTNATGQVVGHEFRNTGSFTVRLTVTDLRGGSHSVSKVVAVAQTPRPNADFVWSPDEPRFGQRIFFNAAASTSAPGHRIVAFDWDFGSGREGTGMTVSKTYDVDLIPPGSVTGDTVSFNVTLRVTDDTFQPEGVGVVTKSISVKVP